MSEDRKTGLNLVQSILIGLAAGVEIIKVRRRFDFHILFDIEDKVKKKQTTVDTNYKKSGAELYQAEDEVQKKRLNSLVMYGALVDNSDIRRKLRKMDGSEVIRVVEISGVGQTTVYNIRNGVGERCRRDTHERISQAIQTIKREGQKNNKSK